MFTSAPMILTLDGKKVEASIYIPSYIKVKRSWKERLFERPWKPFKKYKEVENETALVFSGVIMVSYLKFAQIEKELLNSNRVIY